MRWMRAVFVFLVACSMSISAAVAQSQDPKLLIGTWDGDLRGAKVSGRVLVIDNIEVNDGGGAAGSGTFGIKGQDLLPIQLMVTTVGDALWVEFTTAGSSSPVKVRLSKDAKTLSGTMRPAGNSTNRELTLKRQ